MEAVFMAIADVLLRLLLSPAFWIILLVLVVLCILIVGYRKCKLEALGGVLYERSFSADGVFAGESLVLTEILHNPGWFPLFFVRLDFFAPAGLTIDDVSCSEYTKLTSIFHIPPFSTVKKEHTVRADQRNHYKLQSANIEYRKNNFEFTLPIEVYVYPTRYDADARLSADLYRAGSAIANRKYIEDPFFLSGIRPYQLGDPTHAINFKASVRSFFEGTWQLMCNSYDSSRNFDTLIILDLTVYTGCESNKFVLEEGLRYACFLFCEALRHGGRIGFATNCSVGNKNFIYIPCETGDAHTKRILEHFAEISEFARRDFSVSSMLKNILGELSIDTDLYLISNMVDDKTAELLHIFERAGHKVCVISPTKG